MGPHKHEDCTAGLSARLELDVGSPILAILLLLNCRHILYRHSTLLPPRPSPWPLFLFVVIVLLFISALP